MKVNQYKIYAPCGIYVARTLGNRLQYPRQNEVAFVGGITDQYIRFPKLFCFSSGSHIEPKGDHELNINSNFDPEQDPNEHLNLQRPLTHYKAVNCTCKCQNINFYLSQVAHAEKKEMSTDVDPIDWYTFGVADVETYIDAAFRSSRENEVYLFMKDEYVLVNYVPGKKVDTLLNGPHQIGHGYPSLKDTAFSEYGIDCAFSSHDVNKAFIFSGNLCAYIEYTPGTTNDRIINGPMVITEMFPFFKGTTFESGIDAAFESMERELAYLFKDNQYALINYTTSDSHLITMTLISQGFDSLKDTIFQSGIDAAFASHKPYEAYLFKGESYALINFVDDYMVDDGLKTILPNWPSLCGILPRKNVGLLDIGNLTFQLSASNSADRCSTEATETSKEYEE